MMGESPVFTGFWDPVPARQGFLVVPAYPILSSPEEHPLARDNERLRIARYFSI
jgi:hypothetical protein